ncbi:uncharacterized protein N7503_003124 [Penicillium pulvis]|uniref:uncharacterized protein n=1 Tax=Penicillium pulvis TaxID=1562058 RepID=UPI00254822A9|nr:uncharacterized protein N7503_003124 [Penicillium pulvis]KAJ5805522.1 hypothetical protein N7503_003124 [Penicillium pulvis]
MGWVGVVTLVATTAYILYRYPPRTWNSPFLPTPDSKPDAQSPSSESEPNNRPAAPPSFEIQTESPQTTPKASTSEPPTPVLTVPTLNLQDSDIRVAIEPPAQPSMNGSTPQVASLGRNETETKQQPSLAPPTLKPIPNTSSLMPPPPPPGLRPLILEPGYSPLDWAALAAKPNNQLRGKDVPPGYLRITPSMLKMQNGRKGRDAWTSYQGKVYNISPYVPYHPGGKGELLRGAGKDSAKLFQEVHPWVNWDGILSECLVGILVSENDPQAENALDAMD